MHIKIGTFAYKGYKQGTVQVMDFGASPESLTPETCISLCLGEPPEKSISQMTEKGVWHMVQTNQDDFQNQLEIAAKLIQEPKSFLENPVFEIFKNSQEKRWKFRSSNEKQKVLSAVEKYVRTIPQVRGIVGAIKHIADELFTNAVFNAPFYDSSVSLDRSTIVVLDADLMAELIVAHDDKKLFLGCIDLFGSLDCENLLERLENSFRLGAAQSLNMGKGGAGVGLYQMVGTSAEVYVVVEETKKTLVGCTFNLGGAQAEFKTRAKSLHFVSFRNLTLGTLQIRIQKRKNKLHVDLEGLISEKSNFKKIEVDGIDEIFFDFSKLKGVNAKGAKQWIKWTKSLSSSKRLYCNGVPLSIIEKLNKAKVPFFKFAQIRSFSLPVKCEKCATVTHLLFVRHTNVKDEDMDFVNCNKCGVSLNLSEKTGASLKKVRLG